MGSRTPVTEVPAAVRSYLDEQRVLHLATASPAGVPHATSLLYVLDDLDFHVWTRPDTVTAKHIDENPAVAFTIGEHAADWTKQRGLQAAGECKVLLDPSAIRRVADLFDQRFPGVLPERRHHLSFFRIRPYQLHFIDNTERSPEDARAEGGFHRSLVYDVFSDLPHGEVAAVEAKLDQVSVPAGEVVVRQGAPAEKFFIIVGGAVEVIREDGGESRVVATLEAGQFFGEMAILHDTPRTATVRTIAPTTLLTMDRASFRTLVAQSLATTQNLDEVIRQRMAALDGR
jgi:uncharacterized protein YhbP (UPF0306 family)